MGQAGGGLELAELSQEVRGAVEAARKAEQAVKLVAAGLRRDKAGMERQIEELKATVAVLNERDL